MAETELTEADYQTLLRPFERALLQARLELDFYLRDIGPLNLFAIESRLKTYKSATEKARIMALRVEDLHDLAGLRIIVATAPEVEVIKAFFKNLVDRSQAKLIKSSTIERRDGYRSTHMVIEVSHAFTHLPYSDARIEIQIPTMLQHAFNFISRAWVYKNEEKFPPEWKRKFANVSSALSGTEAAIATLQDEVIRDLRTDAPLTPFSYVRMVRDELHEDVPLPSAIETSYYLSLWGYSTNGHVLALFRDPEIASLWRRYRALRPTLFAETKEQFWTSLGTRLDFTRAHIAELESKSTPESTDDDTGQ